MSLPAALELLCNATWQIKFASDETRRLRPNTVRVSRRPDLPCQLRVPAGEHLFLDMLAISFACSALVSPSPALLSPSMALLSPSPARLAPAAAHRSTTVRCSLAFERVESAKACAIAAGEYFRIRTRAPCCSLLTSVSSNLNSRSRRRCRVSTRQTLDALGIRGKVVDGHE